MKKLFLIGCLLCALSNLNAQLSVNPLLTPAYKNDYTTQGSIVLNIDGGEEPYTVTWSNGSTGETINNLEPGVYTYVVVDAADNTISGDIQLTAYAKWMDADNLTVDKNTVTKTTIASKWGEAGTNSFNVLKHDQNGFVSYKVPAGSASFAFGMGFNDSDPTISYTDIEYGLVRQGKDILAVINGVLTDKLSSLTTNDVLKIQKTGNVISFYKNATKLGDDYTLTDDRDLHLELALYDRGHVQDIMASFFTPPLSAIVLRGDLLDDRDSTGLLSVTGMYGMPPYDYYWDNSLDKQSLLNLREGQHQCVISDDLGNSVTVYASVGHKPAYSQLKNLTITDKGFAKTDAAALANAVVDSYFSGADGGWLEFKIADKTKQFNLLLREIDPADPNSLNAPFIEHISTNVTLNAADIAAMGPINYAKLNLVSDDDYPNSVVVQQQSFVDAVKDDGKTLTGTYGIISKDGKLYMLSGGLTHDLPVTLSDDDVIRFVKSSTTFQVYVNGQVIHQSNTTTGGGTHVNINLWDYTLSIYYLITGGATPWPKVVDCATTARNWVQTTSYDGNLNVAGASRQYLDDLGRVTQSLAKDITRSNVIASQTLYDVFGRQVLTSLPAPTFQSSLCYIDHFMDNTSGAAYNSNDYDIPNWTSNFYNLTSGERDAPKEVDISYKGGVGWYYSNNNDEEHFVATAETPYQRVEYDITNPAEILRSSKAGLGLNHGSGHETLQLTMKTAGELYYFFGFTNSWKVTDMESHFTGYSACHPLTNIVTQPMMNMEGTAIKKIGVDENGVESVSFYDSMNNLIGSCLSGAIDGANQQLQAINDYIDADPNNAFRWVDVHLPDGCQGSLELEQSGNQILYDIINLKNGRCDAYLFGGPGTGVGGAGTKPNLGPGYYRIKLVSMPAGYHNQLRVKYNTNYYNFTANYYDRANRLRITVPPNGIDYDGSALTTTNLNNGHIAKKFETTDSYAAEVIGGGQPDYTHIPVNWELGAGSGSHEMSLPVTNGSTNYVHNFIVKFTGQTTSWAMSQFNDEPVGGEMAKTSQGSDALSGNLLKLKYTLLDTTTVYKKLLPIPYVDVDNGNNNLPPGFNAFSTTGTYCYSQVMPVVITYQIVDGSNAALSGVNYVTGYCTITQCSGNTISYSRSWSFPPQTVQQLPANAYTGNFTARLQILDMYAVHNIISNPNGVPWQDFTDITADFSVRSGEKPNAPGHTMTEVFEYDSWSQLTISKQPDQGETDYIYSPEGLIRASQNAKQDMTGSTTADRFSYTNYDENGRETESGEYDRSLSSASPNIKFKNYREFVTDNTAPSAIIEANVNDAIIDASRRKEVSYMYYDAPDPNFYSQTGLNSSQFSQEHLLGSVSWAVNDNQTCWYSYDEQGRIKWKVIRFKSVSEDVTPGNNYMIKTFYYNYDYLGNVTEKYYQYQMADNMVSDKLKQQFFYDQDARLIKAQSTIYATSNPVTKTNAEYFYYKHGPLKRVQLADNLQGIDYVYTVNGWLKNINSPEMDLQHDPGADGVSLMGNTSYEDLYGQSLDYFNGDYERLGTKIQTFSQGFVYYQYTGNIMSYRWQSKAPAGSNLLYANQQLAYAYSYDRKGQMTMAQFGYVTANDANPTLGGYNTGPNIAIGVDYRVETGYDDNGNIKRMTRFASSSGPDGQNMDDITYNYQSCTNKLTSAVDAVGSFPTNPYAGVGFNNGQGNGNYEYDALGELITDQMNFKKYIYNSDGQIAEVDDIYGNKMVQYAYDESGSRILKVSYDPTNSANITKTLYVRDAGGEVVAIFEKPVASTLFSINEWDIGASGRVASAYKVGNDVTYVYELDDHLGSTRTTFGESLKTIINTYFGDHMKSADIRYFTDPNNTLVHQQAGNGWSAVFAPGQQNGIQSVNLPAAPGDNITASIDASFVGTNLPNAYLMIQLINGAGNVIGTAYAPVTSASQNNNWNNINTSLTNNSGGNAFFKVFVRNTSTMETDFDHIVINYGQGGVRYPKQLDVNNYYPHGSDMPGLTYHSTLGGRYGYQGQYSENDKEIGELFFEMRNYDPLLGRFKTIDPYGQYHSPYMAMGNSHPNVVDPTGGTGLSWSWAGAVVGGVAVSAIAYGIAKAEGADNYTAAEYAAGGVAAGFVAGGLIGGDAKFTWKKLFTYTKKVTTTVEPVINKTTTYLWASRGLLSESYPQMRRTVSGGGVGATLLFDAFQNRDQIILTDMLTKSIVYDSGVRGAIGPMALPIAPGANLIIDIISGDPIRPGDSKNKIPSRYTLTKLTPSQRIHTRTVKLLWGFLPVSIKNTDSNTDLRSGPRSPGSNTQTTKGMKFR